MLVTRAELVLIVLTLAIAGGGLVGRTQVKPKVVFGVDVKLVQIPVVVFNEKGAVATDLQKNDFRVTEDGVEQRLLYCDRQRESVSFVIVDDVSQSMTSKIPFVREATASVLDPLYPQDRYQDEFAVFGIESRVIRLASFTKDQQDLERRLPALLTPTDGSTALFDGIYAAVSVAQREAENKRRAVIIISDGGDNHSRFNLRETRRLLEEAGMPVFAVMAGSLFELSNLLELPKRRPQFHKVPVPVPNADIIGPAERQGPRNLKMLTEVTGGGVFTANDLEDLTRITRTISIAVRYQYLLSFEPSRTEQVKRANNWHKLSLELMPNKRFKGYSVYYRRGYYGIE
jgi:Ca-activated chloride channel family protein